MNDSSTFTLPGVDMTNSTAIAAYYQIHAIPQRYYAHIIVASVIVAILGSYATLFILGKRTSNSGLRNILLLVLGATTMSFVAIWGMHFIGMHFRLAATPTMSWYVYFNPGFTAFSVLVPSIALIVAFLFVDQSHSGFSYWRVVIAGIVTGGTVALMHYSASFHCNFNVSYAPGNTIASILLACLCCIIGLTAFFRFQAQWQTSWWKRLLCALILGFGVSGMHYTGASGTSYRVKEEFLRDVGSLTIGKKRNNVMVTIICASCVVVLIASTLAAVFDFSASRQSRKKARKLVVASATFDKTGRLMVQADGTLPLITVEEKVLRLGEVLEALDQRSSLFQWLYTISWDWDLVVPFITAIANRLFELEKEEQRQAQRKELTASQKARRILSGRYQNKNDGVFQHQSNTPLIDFRDKVIDAASRLAVELDVPLTSVGVLYDKVLATGTRRAAEQAAADAIFRHRLEADSSFNDTLDDDRSGRSGPSRSSFRGTRGDEEEEEGVTLFLVREVDQEYSTEMAKKGYRFTETRFVSTVLADRHAVMRSEMYKLLDSLRVYAKRGAKPVVQPGGVYTGLFGVKQNPTHPHDGLDVLVYNFAHHQIPAYRLPEISSLNEEMKMFLKLIDQRTMEDVMRSCEVGSIRASERNKTISNFLESQSRLSSSSREEAEIRQLKDEQKALSAIIAFQQALRIALEALLQSLRFYPYIVTEARVSSEVLEVPSSLTEDLPPAQIILVQAVLPSDELQLRRTSTIGSAPSEKPTRNTPFVFTPYSLFARSQMMMLRGPSADEFELQVFKEMTVRYPTRIIDMDEEKKEMLSVKMEEVTKTSQDVLSEKALVSSPPEIESPSKAKRYMKGMLSKGDFVMQMGEKARRMSLAAVNASPPPKKNTSDEPYTEMQEVPLQRSSSSSGQDSSQYSPTTTKRNGGTEAVDKDLAIMVDQASYVKTDDDQSPTTTTTKSLSSSQKSPSKSSLKGSSASYGLPYNSGPKSASKSVILKSTLEPSLVAPTRKQRPSTVEAMHSNNTSSSNNSSSNQAAPAYATSRRKRRPRTAESGTSATNFDNWQTRQMRALEKNQSTALMGILPSEY